MLRPTNLVKHYIKVKKRIVKDYERDGNYFLPSSPVYEFYINLAQTG